MKKILSLLVVICLLFTFVSCGKKGSTASGQSNKIVIAASPSPHAEILEFAKSKVEAAGYELVIREFSDYVQPNLVTDNGEVDANYFQHVPYLEDFNKERGTKLVSVGSVHYEPFGIYAGTSKSLEVSEGSKIAVPNDVTNEARALNLLESAGLIKLKQGAGLTATKLDIVDNPLKLDIVELEAAQIPRSLGSVALSCMNGNYALDAGFKVKDALFVEKADSIAATTYANIICVHEKNKNAEFVKVLMDALTSTDVADFINSKYEGSVLPSLGR